FWFIIARRREVGNGKPQGKTSLELRGVFWKPRRGPAETTRLPHADKSRRQAAFGASLPLETKQSGRRPQSRPAQSADWAARAKLRRQFCGLDGGRRTD